LVGLRKPAGDAVVQFDDPVDGLGPAVVRAAGGEVGEELLAPGAQGAAEAGDLGDPVPSTPTAMILRAPVFCMVVLFRRFLVHDARGGGRYGEAEDATPRDLRRLPPLAPPLQPGGMRKNTWLGAGVVVLGIGIGLCAVFGPMHTGYTRMAR